MEGQWTAYQRGEVTGLRGPDGLGIARFDSLDDAMRAQDCHNALRGVSDPAAYIEQLERIARKALRLRDEPEPQDAGALVLEANAVLASKG